MNKSTLRSLLLLIVLLGLSIVALAWAQSEVTARPDDSAVQLSQNTSTQLLSLEVALSQGKVIQGGDGLVSLAMTLHGAESPESKTGETSDLPVDMVIVLDRSGSMSGSKIDDAKVAVKSLFGMLHQGDRVALVSYSDHASIHCDLIPNSSSNSKRLLGILSRIHAKGGTNLGEGLREGMNILADSHQANRNTRLLLISDGIANQGVTGIRDLSAMASEAITGEFTISTVGVGLDFNEALLTAIADHGGGGYQFLEQPDAFAQVFIQELMAARTAVARNCMVTVPEVKGVRLVEAGGYPIEVRNGKAVFHPGEVLSGQTRSIILTYRVPTSTLGTVTIPAPTVSFDGENGTTVMSLPAPLYVACVKDEGEVVASMDKGVWEQKVLQEDYSRLQEEVAKDIAEGNESNALSRINSYREKQQRLNARVGSARVQENLDQDLATLERQVEMTQNAAPSAAPELRKSEAKKIHHSGYLKRRDKDSAIQ